MKMSLVAGPQAMNKEKAYKRLVKRQVQRSYSDTVAITSGELANTEFRQHRPLSLGTSSSDSKKNDRSLASASTLRRGISLQDFADRVVERPTTSVLVRTTKPSDQFPPIYDKRSHYITLVPTNLHNASSSSGQDHTGDASSKSPECKQSTHIFPSASSIRKLFAADYSKKSATKQHVKFNQSEVGIIKNSSGNPNSSDVQRETKSAKLYRLRTPKRSSVKQVSFTDNYAIEDDSKTEHGVRKPAHQVPGGDSYALTERNLEIHASFLLPKHKFVKTTENKTMTTKRMDERVLKWVEERNFSVKLSCHDIPEMEEDGSVQQNRGQKQPTEVNDWNSNIITNKKFVKEKDSEKDLKISDTSTSTDEDEIT